MLDKSSNTIAWYESQTCLFQKQPIQPFAICHLTCPHVRHQGWFLLQVNTWLIVFAQKLWRIQIGKCRITLLHCYLMCDFVLLLYLSAEIWVHAIVLHTSGSDLGSHHITDANVSFRLPGLLVSVYQLFLKKWSSKTSLGICICGLTFRLPFCSVLVFPFLHCMHLCLTFFS